MTDVATLTRREAAPSLAPVETDAPAPQGVWIERPQALLTSAQRRAVRACLDAGELQRRRVGRVTQWIGLVGAAPVGPYAVDGLVDAGLMFRASIDGKLNRARLTPAGLWCAKALKDEQAAFEHRAFRRRGNR